MLKWVPYVNSLWQLQDRPFAGDAVNAYNDGPATPGAGQLGPFYEMETSSPAAELAAGASLAHCHRTFHLSGDREAVNALAKQVLGVDLKQVAEGERVPRRRLAAVQADGPPLKRPAPGPSAVQGSAAAGRP